VNYMFFLFKSLVVCLISDLLQAKNKLQGIIDTYISEQIQLADKAISITIQSKISDGNVILTYG